VATKIQERVRKGETQNRTSIHKELELLVVIGRQAEQSIEVQQYGGEVKMWVEAQRRSDLNQLEVAAKDTREYERER
jgi:hypothetical protein